jgi:hypothetical protein
MSPTPAKEPEHEEIVVKASLARAEIERILRADNLDTANTNPGILADAMGRIRRGKAPIDFWNSYQSHVRAWELFADVAGNAQSDQREAIAAERAINSTFDEVERIALRYGARMPKSVLIPKPTD